MIWEAFILLVAGMGTVMVFLSLLFGVMNISAFIFLNYIKEEAPAASHIERLQNDDSAEIAVALAAVRHFQKN